MDNEQKLFDELKKLLLEVRHGAYITPKIHQIINLFKKYGKHSDGSTNTAA